MPQVQDDPFAAYEAKASSDDPFADYAVKQTPYTGDHNRKPASAEDFAPPQRDVSVGNLLLSGLKSLNPIPAIKAIAADQRPEDATLGPAAALAPILRMAGAGAASEAGKTAEAARAGHLSEAAGHAVATALPLVGPAAASAGEDIGSGDPERIERGGGNALGLVVPMVAGAVAPRSVSIPAVGAGTDTADALALAERAGIPVDAASATGNKFIKAAQHVSDRSLTGSLVAGRAAEAQRAGLATLGEQLAAKANSRAVTAGEAGSAAQAGVGDVVKAQHSVANEAYSRLRDIEAAPENLTTIHPEPVTANPDAPPFFSAKAKPTSDELFSDVLKDARVNGYEGKVGDLRAKFDERVASAKGLKSATAEGDEYSHAALLKEIRDRGGLRPSDPSFVQGGPTRQMKGEFTAAQQASKNYYGKNAIYRNDGLATDDMLQQLSEDPKWGAVITPDTDLNDVIHRGAMLEPKATYGLEHHLKGVGVEPGVQWWREGEQAKHVPMAVDLSPVKEALAPIVQRLMAKKDVTGALMGSEGAAAAKLHAIVNGPDAVPLSVADSALSDLKRMARTNHPELRNVGQGLAARAVGNLHKMVSEAAERAGPDAVSALEEGRTATKAKYAAADVLRKLEGAQRTKSPVTAFRGMTQAGDSGVGHLSDVLKQSPATKPLIARAVLDGLIDHPTAGPAKTWSDWQKIGPETKALLYAPEHVKDLDSFFKLRKMMAENPNPSGTAHTLLTAGQAGLLFTEPVSGAAVQIGTGLLSTLLHSRSGVRLLTRGMTIPVKSAAASAAWAADFAAATGQKPTSASARLPTLAGSGAR